MKRYFAALNYFILITVLFQMGCSASDEVTTRQVAIDGEVITEDQARREGAKELEALELKMLQNKASYTRNEHMILGQVFEQLIDEKLIKMEAESRGITEEELIEMDVRQNVQEPSEDVIGAFYEANKDRIALSKEDSFPQIRDYLKQNQENSIKEEFLAGLEKEHKVIRNIDHLRFEVDAPDRPSDGPSAAPVVLVEFSDFQCPYCQTFSDTLKKVVGQYEDKVRLVFRQYPLSSIHPDAQRAAEASLCAADQNRFWDMHDLFFENQQNLLEEDILNKAEQLGLDTETLQACLSEEKYGSMVQEDLRAGAIAGVEGTPTLFINGRYLSGNRSFEEIVGIIDEELGKTELQ